MFLCLLKMIYFAKNVVMWCQIRKCSALLFKQFLKDLMILVHLVNFQMFTMNGFLQTVGHIA